MNPSDERNFRLGLTLGMRYFYDKLIETFNKERIESGDIIDMNKVLSEMHNLLEKDPVLLINQAVKSMWEDKILQNNRNKAVN
jgi:hypothetical protein